MNSSGKGVSSLAGNNFVLLIMKKKYSYLFEKEILKKKVLCEQDAIELVLKGLKGKTLPEQLHKRGIWIITVDNKVEEKGYLASAHSPGARKFFSSIRGFREEDFLRARREFLIGINFRKHRHRGRKKIDLPELCNTFAHEFIHASQYHAHTDDRYIDLHGRLSIRMNDVGDEDFCDEGAKAWLAQDDNYAQAESFLKSHRRHNDHSWVFPTHIRTFPF